ncbi:DNA-binding response regulator [Lachnospiraceae bacterium ZAX-1]
MENKYAVMVVDDDSSLLKMAGNILSGTYEVSYAKSGDAALALLESDYLPDIILLDIEMPGLNGFETLVKLRELEDTKGIPVVFLTGVNTEQAEVQGLNFGAVDYIKKPFVREILLARLKVHLENGRRLRKIARAERDKMDSLIDKAKFEKETAVLTDTEKKMALLIARGYNNRDIADALHYTYGYVRKVVSVIYEKKGVSKRGELKNLFT